MSMANKVVYKHASWEDVMSHLYHDIVMYCTHVELHTVYSITV